MGEMQKNECILSDGERFELPEHIGDEYSNKIRKGIDSSKYFLLIYTKEVENSARYIVMCGASIGAGSFVLKDVPAGDVVAGNPAKIIKKQSVTDRIARNLYSIREKSRL